LPVAISPVAVLPVAVLPAAALPVAIRGARPAGRIVFAVAAPAPVRIVRTIALAALVMA
jgi:hypothetical protein